MAKQTEQPGKFDIGDGVEAEVTREGKLIISCDLRGDYGLSQSGKTRIIASTRGGHKFPGGVTLSLNLYKKA